MGTDTRHPARCLGMMLSLAALAACTTPGVTADPAVGAPDTAAREIAIRVPSGGHHLPGTLFVAAGPGPHPTLVWFHGFPGMAGPVAEAVGTLRDAGLNVLHVHYRGSWGTSGTFGPAHALQDAAATLAHVWAAPPSWRVDKDRIVAAGDSFGSWVALQAGAADPRIACVAAALVLDLGRTGRDLAADADVRAAFGEMFTQVEQDPALQYTLQDGAPGLLATLIDQRARHDLHALAPALRTRPVLLIGAADDTLAPVDAHLVPVAEALEAAGVPVARAILPGGHELSDADYAGRVAEWVRSDCLAKTGVKADFP